MKFVCYKEYDDPAEPAFPGVLYKGKILPLARVVAVAEAFHPRGTVVPEDLNTLITLLADYSGLMSELEKTKALDQIWQEVGVTPVAPLPRPNRLFGIGRNYAEHATELGNEPTAEPIVFLKASSSVIATGQPIAIPPDVGRVDYEGELAVVIGRLGKALTEKDAMNFVAGYTLANDVTARDEQKRNQARGLPWFLAKSHDTFCPLGPCLVTADELRRPATLELTVTVNGEVRQQASIGAMIHSIPALIVYLSRRLTLEPGDVILTGTPAGVGPLAPGDTVEVRIPEIGTLTSPVIASED